MEPRVFDGGIGGMGNMPVTVSKTGIMRQRKEDPPQKLVSYVCQDCSYVHFFALPVE